MLTKETLELEDFKDVPLRGTLVRFMDVDIHKSIKVETKLGQLLGIISGHASTKFIVFKKIGDNPAVYSEHLDLRIAIKEYNK
jgi:hypothetical protein